MSRLFSWVTDCWDRFLFQSTDYRMWPIFRVLFGVILCIYSAHLYFEAEFFFSSDGVFPAANALELAKLEGHAPSIFFLGDDSPGFAQLCFGIFFLQSVLLTIGLFSRIQMIGIFAWLVSSQVRCPIIFEGEDVLFRMLSFFSIFAPLSIRFSLDNFLWSKISGRQFTVWEGAGWPVRLIQIQMTMIYTSTALEKSVGADWQNGNALYYASRLHDLFGRFPVPGFLFEDLWMLRMMTWTVLFLECLLPILLWIPKTRIWGVLLGFGLHLGIEYSMNLLLFQWGMMLGLMMFLNAGELPWLGRRFAGKGNVQP